MSSKNSFLCLLYVFLLSCESDQIHLDYLNKIGLRLMDTYKIKSEESNFAIGDSQRNFQLIISQRDFEEIKNKIEGFPRFKIYDSKTVPSSPYASGFSVDSDTVAYKRNGAVHYEIYYDIKNSGYEIYELTLKNDSLLEFRFIEE